MSDAAERAAREAFLDEGLLGPVPMVRNVDAAIEVLRVGADRLPVVVNRRGDPRCSWVASLRNAYGRYGRAEIDIVRMRPAVRPLFRAASHAAEALLMAGGLGGGSFLANWLVATNLHPAGLGRAEIGAAVDELVRREPGLPVVIRSLTPPLHGALIEGLAADGFLLLPARQVWLLAESQRGVWRERRDCRSDLRLARDTADRWTWLGAEAFSDADFGRAHELYQRLYRGRYPLHNPDFSEAFLRAGAGTGFLELVGLRPSAGGPLAGVLGMIRCGGVAATPVLGYDLDSPADAGLYRLLTLRAFLHAERNGLLLHCSAGAGAFKASRGATPAVEFVAVWANHLPAYRRASLRVLSAVLRGLVVPYLERNRL